MLATPKAKSELFLASSLCDGLEDNNIKQVTTLLLSKEADPNVLIPSYGITPFHLVIGNDSEVFAEEVTKLFLRHGGNPNVTSAEGLTPVHVAAAWGRVGVLELLLANGGDPLWMDDERRTPFHYAFDGKYYKAIAVLGRYCADAIEKDEGFKYKRRLDKVLVNNGDMLAEYVVSEGNASGESSSPRVDQCISYNESRAPDSPETEHEEGHPRAVRLDEGGARPYLFSSNVTVRKRSSSWREEVNRTAVTSPMDDFAQMKIERANDREKVLVSEIISYLSTSVLNESSEEVPVGHREGALKGKPRTAMSTINPWRNGNDVGGDPPKSKGYDDCRTRTARKVSLIPQLRHKAGERDGNSKIFVSSPKTPLTGKVHLRSVTQSTTVKNDRRCISRIPVRLEYSPDDCIVSKSPNMIVPSSLRDSRSRTAFVLRKRSMMSKNCEKCHLTPSKTKNHEALMDIGRKIAQSTPRRRQARLQRQTSRKELKSRKNYVLRTTNVAVEKCDVTENFHRSFDSSLPTTSPDERDSHKIRANGLRSCAIKLDEGKYDEDDASNESASRILQSDTIKFPYVLGSRTIPETDKDDYCDTGVARNASFSPSENNSSMDSINNNIRFNAPRSKDKFTSVDARDNHVEKCKSFDRRVYMNTTEGLQEKDLLEESPRSDAMNFCASRVHAPAKYFDKHVYNTWGNDSIPEKGDNASLRSSVVSCVSVQEEYKYEDPEEGVKFVERRYCVQPSSAITGDEDHEYFSAKGSCNSTMLSAANLPAGAVLLDDHALRTKLTQLGDIPGPITNTTRHIYLKRLVRLQKQGDCPVGRTTRKEELRNRISSRLQYGSWVNELITLQRLEKRVFAEFTAPEPSRRWREGTAKTSFNYLLLDSRVTEDLPYRACSLSESDVWTAFVSSIFYIGKGKRSRPYAHLYDAFHAWVSNGSTACPNGKIQHILDIWNEGYGVICLHVFQNVIPVEAYTREAAMIDAVGLENLRNSKSGEYYGIAATWSIKEKCRFGRYLLYRAMKLLLHEGERQLFPQHL